MGTRAPGAPFDTLNVVIGRLGRYELTLSFRIAPNRHTLLHCLHSTTGRDKAVERQMLSTESPRGRPPLGLTEGKSNVDSPVRLL